MYRILTSNGSKTTTELVELAVQAERRGEVALRAEHHAGRRFRPLHRTAAARRAGEGLLSFVMPTVRGCGHEPDVGHRRTRAAQVLPLARADDGVHGVSAGAADRAGQRVRRQDQRRAAGRGRPGPRHAGGEGPRGVDCRRRPTRAPSTPVPYDSDSRPWRMCATADSTAPSSFRRNIRAASTSRTIPASR